MSHITQELKKHMQDKFLIYTVIPGHKINSGTKPPDVLSAELRPHIVLLDRKAKTIYLWELTCSFEKNITAAHLRKSSKYFDLNKDLTVAG